MTLYLPVIFVTEDPMVFLVRRYSQINASKKCYSPSDQTTSKSAPICRGSARVALINIPEMVKTFQIAVKSNKQFAN